MNEIVKNDCQSEAIPRSVNHDEAQEIALRLISGSFRRDNERLSSKDRPRFSIPTRPDHDDDCLIIAYIDQQRCAADEITSLQSQLKEAREIIETLANKFTSFDNLIEAIGRAREFLSQTEKDNG